MASSASRIAELESELRAVEKERDELAADVERLCLQSGSSKFDPTKLLTERLRAAELDVKQLRQQLSALKEEREITLEELQEARSANVASEQSAAQLSERCKGLERDVAFYKERAVKAMAERDQEIDNMRAEVLEGEARLQHMTQSMELVQASNKDLEARLCCLHSELDSLRQQQMESQRQNEKQQAASALAEVELRQLQDTVHFLEDSAQKLRAQLSEVQAEASHTHKLLKQAHKIEDQLSGQVRELQAQLATARRQRSSGGQSPQSSPAEPRSRPDSAGGASVDGAGASSIGPKAPSSPPLSSSSASSPAAAGARPAAAAATGPSPGSHTPSPRGGAAAGRALSAATAAAVTVTAAEAAAADQAPPLRQAPPEPPPDVAAPAGPATGVSEASPAASSPSASSAAEAEPSSAAGVAERAATEAAAAFHGSLLKRIRELEAALAQAQEELSRERAVHEDEREQLQVLRTMAHDFKIKLAQATQEKVQALMKAATLTQSVADAKQQQQLAGAGAPSWGQSPSVPAPHRQASMSSERSSRDLSRSPSTSFGLFPATSAPAPAGAGGGGTAAAATTGGQPSAKSLWAAWLGGSGGGWYGTPATAAAPPAAPAPATAAAPAAPQYAASVASEEGSEAGGGGSAVAAAAAAAAHAATVEAAEGRSRRLAAQLERVRSQLAAIDRLAGQVGRCEARLRGCGALLWSRREEDAPRRWAALSDLTRLAEECSALRTEAGLPAAAAASPPPAVAGPAAADPLPPVLPLPLALAASDVHRHHRQQPLPQQHAGGLHAPGDDDGAGSGGEYDSSLVCTREAGGVQRRVAEVLLGSVEFGVRSLEQYSHQSALTSVMY
ncbi:hypothetical protein PLESTF_000215900 [Pleodorina starrii]|nr:hypothetical protein PLESTF_000215900 [Pleodorina starrii]